MTSPRQALQEYSMTRKPRGLCLIINNVNFSDNKLYRAGSEKDKDFLEKVFRDTLYFSVVVKKNKTNKGIDKLLKRYANKDHSRYDCFVCCFLSHGKEEQLTGVNGQHVSLTQVTSHFQASKCKSLAGKPKLFFIQTCQGPDDMKGGTVERDYSHPGSTTESKTVTIPDEADFLLGFATAVGYVSYRDKKEGSPYIQTLCNYLEKFGPCRYVYDIMDIMTMVNRRVSEREFNGEYKQMPSMVSRLTRKLYF